MYKLTKGDKMIDKEYRDDHDYLSAINKFSNKDMLKLALYQEWVNRRYTKPIWDKSIGLSLFTISLLICSLYLKQENSLDLIKEAILLLSIMVISIVASYIFLTEPKKDENTEVAKLNAIRDAIEFLSK